MTIRPFFHFSSATLRLCAFSAAAGLAPVYSASQNVDPGQVMRNASTSREARQAARAAEQAQGVQACERLKRWISSLPLQPNMVQGNARYLPYVEDKLFSAHFGKTYDQLDANDLHNARLGQRECQRQNSFTPAERQLVSMIWSQSMQPRLAQQLIASRGQPEQANNAAGSLPPPSPTARQGNGGRTLPPVTSTPPSAPVTPNTPSSRPQTKEQFAAITQLMGRCDTLAADPDDPTRKASGVADDAISADAAVAACRAAVEAAPAVPRMHFQYGRALIAAGKQHEAVAALQRAAKSNHPAALAYLATAYQYGAGGLPKDEQKAAELQQQADALGYGGSTTATAGATSSAPPPAASSSSGSAGGSSGTSNSGTTPASRKAGSSSADQKLKGNFEQPEIVKAIYFDDTTPLSKDRLFNLKYLLTQATILANDCRSFKLTEIRGYEERFNRMVMPSNGDEMVAQGAKNIKDMFDILVRSRDNPQVMVDAGSEMQRQEDAPAFAARDIQEFADNHGACGSAPMERYTRNMRNFFDTSAFVR